MSGKGSKRRPAAISHEEWSKQWDAVFGARTKTAKSDDTVPMPKKRKSPKRQGDTNGNT